MKKSLLISMLLLFSVSIFCQQNHFKVKNKKQPGSKTTSINFMRTNGLLNYKSATISSFKVAPVMTKPNLQGKDSLVKIIGSGNTPIYLERISPLLKSAKLISPEERFFSFFESTQSSTHIKNPRESFSISKIETDQLGITHLKSVQLYKGIEVYGSESTLHLDAMKERFTGRILKINKDIDIHPKISSSEAVHKTLENLKQHTVVKDLSENEKSILKYDSPQVKLVVFDSNDNTFSLAYEIEARPNFIEVWKYFIDAQTGSVLRKFNATNTNGPATATAYDLNNVLRTVNTYLEDGTYYMVDVSEPMFVQSNFEGSIMTLNANNTSSQKLNYTKITSANNIWTDKTAVSAHANTIATFKYLNDTHKRNSLNGKGGTIYSFINVTNDDGSSMDNAYWNGQAAFYGNGKDLKPLAGAQDVISHELGHGVISNTANLEYYAQSGAINESFADIFGAMVDRDDWLIGEDIIKSGKPMRNMKDPHNGGTNVFDGWQPRHMTEIVTGAVLDNFSNRDQEGVHINSGIGNYAFYLYATAVSKEKAEKVFYRSLVNYLTKSSQFIDLRIAVIQSAKDLFGENSTEATEAAKAFENVGIYGDVPVVDNPQYEVNNGDEYMLSYNTDATYSTKLYRTSSSGENFISLTKTDMKGKVSVTDDGEVAAYVTTDDKIRALTLDPKNIQEIILSNEAFWDNVAISKDGMRMAAISNEIDASIYVYDFGTKKWLQFQLYNPTTSHANTDAGGVLFADEIEFDITGEYLIYDAYNELNSTTAGDINYWDIGFIKVWDNGKNAFGDGSISKLYGSLPKDVSIGNPVFSKNSPDIIAFDYFDEKNDEYAIIGANLLTSDIDVIYLNTTLGFPSFSKKDDRMAFTALDNAKNEVIGIIDLAVNKISAKGNAQLLIDLAKWPVYYSTGTRKLGLPPVANFTVDFKTGAAPIIVKFFDASLNDPETWKWTFTGGSPATSTEKNPIVTYSKAGTYSISLIASNSFGNNTATKTNYIVVGAPTGTNDLDLNPVSIYPNPTGNILNITCQGNYSLKILDIYGKLVIANKNQKQIDLSGISAGIYFVELETESGVVREKVIKN